MLPRVTYQTVEPSAPHRKRNWRQKRFYFRPAIKTKISDRRLVRRKKTTKRRVKET